MGWANNYITRLKSNETVTFRPRGNSMLPYIKSGQEVTVAPLSGKEPKVGDIVLCTVAGNDYLHFVKATRTTVNKVRQYQIVNAKDYINGWITIKDIHGIKI